MQVYGPRVAATILGVLGGLVGLAVAAWVAFAGFMPAGLFLATVPATQAELLAMGFSTLGVVGGAIAIPWPRVAMAFLVAAFIGGMVLMNAVYFVAGALLLAGVASLALGLRHG